MEKITLLQPKDVIAILVLVSFIYLRTIGVDSAIDSVIALILGYYFVKRTEGKDDGTGGLAV